uniref:Putative secreted protein n=1 Tax=Anopheles marajoara TaxID=58244 RepID=A0A2M4C605_9DIPT
MSASLVRLLAKATIVSAVQLCNAMNVPLADFLCHLRHASGQGKIGRCSNSSSRVARLLATAITIIIIIRRVVMTLWRHQLCSPRLWWPSTHRIFAFETERGEPPLSVSLGNRMCYAITSQQPTSSSCLAHNKHLLLVLLLLPVGLDSAFSLIPSLKRGPYGGAVCNSQTREDL